MAETEILERAGTDDHRITVERAGRRLSVIAGDSTVLATSDHAVILREAGYPPVPYFPKSDVAEGRLDLSDRVTHCPYKGDATHYAARLADGHTVAPAAWSYEAPIERMGSIAGKLGFYLGNLGEGARIDGL